MRVGVFTPLLSQLPLAAVLKKLAALHINTVELATGNYVGDAHCKLSMLEDAKALAEFKKILADNGFSISALSCHGNPLHPDKARAQTRSRSQPQDDSASRKAGRSDDGGFFWMPWRLAERHRSQLGNLPMAS